MKTMFVQTELRVALATICTCVAHDRLTSVVADGLYARIDEKYCIVLTLSDASSWLTDLYYIQSYLSGDSTISKEVGVLVQVLIDAFLKLQSDIQSEV